MDKKQNGKKAQKGNFEDKLKSDNRFASITTDPKFMTVPKQIKKVKVDKRFSKMRKDKDFLASGQRDHFGKLLLSTHSLTHYLEKVYEFEEESGDEGQDKQSKQILDRDGKFVWNEESSDSEPSEKQADSDVAEDSDEEFWTQKEDIKYGDDVSSRIAVQNLDWDHVGAQDLFFLFSSFCKGESIVYKVDILPSQYGKERMEHDSLFGPPKGIFDKETDNKKQKLKIKKKQKQKTRMILDNKVKALEEEENFEFNEMELRKYEAQKMKYFYAVVTCDSQATAAHLYKEIDGMEFEQSNLKMDLRFIPDSIEKFPYDPKDSCSEVPDEYECNFFNNRAYGHTRVKLTWDEEDPKKIKVIKKKLDAAKLEEQDFREYIASDSDEEEDDFEEMARKRAILGLDEDSESDEELNQAIGASRKRRKVGVEGDIKISFKSGFEDIGENLLKSKKEKESQKEESAFDTYQRERKQKRRERKQADKEKLEIDEEMKYKKPEEGLRKRHKKGKIDDLLSKNAATTEELELLVDGDGTDANFKPNLKDNRFGAIYDKGAYNIDPTHKEFAKVGKSFLNEHQKRRRKEY